MPIAVPIGPLTVFLGESLTRKRNFGHQLAVLILHINLAKIRHKLARFIPGIGNVVMEVSGGAGSPASDLLSCQMVKTCPCRSLTGGQNV